MNNDKKTKHDTLLDDANQIHSLHTYNLAAKEDSLSTTDHITANTIPEPAKAANENSQSLIEAKNQ